jgi:hypothetical protein
MKMIKDYGMFTDAGNAVVENLVSMAKTHGLSYPIVMSMMDAIGTDECYGEITDTAVRESIGDELGWYI